MTGKRKLGRPKGSGNPSYAAVEVLARELAPYCASNTEAVRLAVEIHLDFGDIAYEGEDTQGLPILGKKERPTEGLLPIGPHDDKRRLSADESRHKAAMAWWQKRLRADGIGPDEPPPWPRFTLASTDTVVDQIARKLLPHPAQRKNSIG